MYPAGGDDFSLHQSGPDALQSPRVLRMRASTGAAVFQHHCIVDQPGTTTTIITL